MSILLVATKYKIAKKETQGVVPLTALSIRLSAKTDKIVPLLQAKYLRVRAAEQIDGYLV